MRAVNFVLSPLDQFEVRDLFSLNSNLLGNINISLTNIGLYLSIGGFIILTYSLLATNNNKIIPNNWSISQETIYATVHSIVINQLNPTKGQLYFPFIYALFIFILVNNLIGMVKRCLGILVLFISNNLLFLNSSLLYFIRSLHITPHYSCNSKNSFYLHPDYITGFTDGEGCFTVSVYKDSRMLTSWQVKPIFSIALHKKDIAILEAIQRTWKVGKIYKHGEDSVQYRVSSLKDLEVVLNHFELYPLITKKQADYILFKKVIKILKNKEHLSLNGLLKVVSIKSVLNTGLSEKLKESFCNLETVIKPEVKISNITNLNWVRGFTEAEGSFQVIFQKNKTYVSLRFSITQHSKDKELLKKLVYFLNCGRYNESHSRNEGQYIVSVFSDIFEKIIPLFGQYSLIGSKKKDYINFVKIADIIKNKDHLNQEGLDKINFIVNKIN